RALPEHLAEPFERPDVSAREHVHPPQTAKEYERGRPRPHTWKGIQSAQRVLGGKCNQALFVEFTRGNQFGQPSQRLRFLPAQPHAGEPSLRRCRDSRRIRKRPEGAVLDVEAPTEPLDEARHQRGASIEADLLIRNNSAKGLEQVRKARWAGPAQSV